MGKILLTGASGYLGQHLLSHWMQNGIPSGSDDDDTTVVALYHKNSGFAEAVQASSDESKVKVTPVCCDLNDAASVDALFDQHPEFLACVHTAALSSPRVCQENPQRARQINIPEYFFRSLSSNVMIAFSTDQVYDGTKDTASQGLYKEDSDVPRPLNVYGQTKLEMENYLKKNTSRLVLLRSSIILGPKAPWGGAHETFLHFCASRGSSSTQETTFFTNEYRTVVSVSHVCRVVDFLLSSPPGSLKGNTFHLGGPVRVNRYEMAQAVFEHLGYDQKFLLPALQTSPTSPLDISMDSHNLERATGFPHEPATLDGIVEEVFPSGCKK